MSIGETFRELKKRDEGALIAFVTGGDPAPKVTLKILQRLTEAGADIIEIGIPFSDPIADGPTIQAADHRALKAGTTPDTIFNLVKEAKTRSKVPIALLTYYNILYRMGLKKFLRQASEHSVDGLIIPDLPVEEAEEYVLASRREGVDTIFLATPLTSRDRLATILDHTRGFLYLVSTFGVTGTRENVYKLTKDTIQRMHPYTVGKIPMAVGFGISKPEHVKTVLNCGAEGAIAGSAFVKIIEDNMNEPEKMIRNIFKLAVELKTATK